MWLWSLGRTLVNPAVNDMTEDHAHAAVARGFLTVPQMQRPLGGLPQHPTKP